MSDRLTETTQTPAGVAGANREAAWTAPTPEYLRDLDRKHRHHADGRLLLGTVIGAVVAMGAVAFFAYDAGSFSQAGASVDSKIDAAATETNQAAAGAVRSVGGAAREAGDTVDETLSDVAKDAEAR